MTAGWAPAPPAMVWLIVTEKERPELIEDEGKDIVEDPGTQKAQGHACRNLCLENHVLSIFSDNQSVQGYFSASLPD